MCGNSYVDSGIPLDALWECIDEVDRYYDKIIGKPFKFFSGILIGIFALLLIVSALSPHISVNDFGIAYMVLIVVWIISSIFARMLGISMIKHRFPALYSRTDVKII